MSWEREYADKLTTAEAAAAGVESGDGLYMGMLTNHPYEFEEALAGRAESLEGVRVYHSISLFPWWVHAGPEHLRHATVFASPLDRHAIAEGRVDYLPFGSWAVEHLLQDHPPVDTAVVSLSPPDRDGQMSFGSCLWLNRRMCLQAGRVLAEIDPGFIRTGGDNHIHVSEVEAMWLREPAERMLADGDEAADTDTVSDSICRLVADQLIDDGDCLQIGTGDVTRRLAGFLGDKRDLGIQTEMIPEGVMPMMERGVITGARKQIGIGKTIGCAIVAPANEIEMAHEHPGLELWDFTRTDDLRVLTQNRNFKAINNALEVDVTGQVNAESIGPRIYSGPGGQPVFLIAACHSPGGAAIVVLPSASLVDGELTSRIVATFRPGTSVTVPRSFVDYVVTEHGIAKLSGKTMRERVAAMIGIAHPELRDGLERRARELYPM